MVDQTTNMPLKEEYQLKQPNGPAANLSLILGDFKPVAGVLFPFKQNLSQNGKKAAEISIMDVKVNTGLKVAVLSRQP